MKRSSLIVVIVAAAVVLIGGLAIYALNQDKSDPMSSMSPSAMKAMDSNQSSGSSDASATNSVTIQDFAFSPKNITVKVGTSVTWTNQDSVKHNVASDDEGGPDGPLLAKGETYSYTFKKVGTFDYHCAPHPYMKATVTVTN